MNGVQTKRGAARLTVCAFSPTDHGGPYVYPFNRTTRTTHNSFALQTLARFEFSVFILRALCANFILPPTRACEQCD
jgi:hypothetical protein